MQLTKNTISSIMWVEAGEWKGENRKGGVADVDLAREVKRMKGDKL